MGKKLIINADGFGFTPGINKGIIETINNGIVTSTSCVVNFPYIEEVSIIKKEYKNISIGIHFNLSVGKPVSPPSEVPSLINEYGEFLGDVFARKLFLGEIRYNEIVKELEAQIKLLFDLGVMPTHWDGHQNKHLYPQFFCAAMNVAKKYNIFKMRTHRRYIFLLNPQNRQLRILNYYIKNPHRAISHFYSRSLMRLAKYWGFKMADRLISPAYADRSKKCLFSTWSALIEHLPEGTNEIYCHPGYPDEILRRYAKYVSEREEVKVLTTHEIKYAIEENNIKLISFKDL
ncbi:MAG: carbohydrate deacetylase [Candidatus Saccharicenans sp.]